MIKIKRFIGIIIFVFWLAGCSSSQATLKQQVINSTTQVTKMVDYALQKSTQPLVLNPTSAQTETVVPPPIIRPTLGPDEWMRLPVTPEISDTVRNIYLTGIKLGNDPTHFSKIGDCQNVASYFLSTFDNPGDFSLGEQNAYLQSTIDQFSGSWSRESLAVKGGFNVAAVNSPLRSDPQKCNKGESPLDCELRVWRPSIVLVSMETWWGKKPAEDYDRYMRQTVEKIISHGAVPILATKADNLEGNYAINSVIAQISSDYDIPLWNYWAAVQPLPNHGLSEDNFHLTFARNFFDDPERMKNAWPWRNLTALQAIDAVYRSVTDK
jgi:hypothetical protein